jgi:hypothetical protein
MRVNSNSAAGKRQELSKIYLSVGAMSVRFSGSPERLSKSGQLASARSNILAMS